jgi:hypothetical protein
MRTLQLLLASLLFTACAADAPADDPAQAQLAHEASVAPLSTENTPLHLDSPGTARHKNCGHEVWCNGPNDGNAVYCYFSQSQTGCTLTQIENDADSDCDAVCGHAACLNSHRYSCSSGCDGQC